MVFTIYGRGGHLGHVTWISRSNFRLPYPWMLHIKFHFDWPSRFLSGFYHIWAWQPSWSCDLDFAISNFRLPYPWMLHIKFHFDWPSRFFKCFYHIWACRPSWSYDQDIANKITMALPKEVPHKISTRSAKRFQRRRSLKLWTTAGRRREECWVMAIL